MRTPKAPEGRLAMLIPGLGAVATTEHDLFIQLAKLENTLRAVAGEAPITHLGLEYYAEDLPLPRR